MKQLFATLEITRYSTNQIGYLCWFLTLSLTQTDTHEAERQADKGKRSVKDIVATWREGERHKSGLSIGECHAFSLWRTLHTPCLSATTSAPPCTQYSLTAAAAAPSVKSVPSSNNVNFSRDGRVRHVVDVVRDSTVKSVSLKVLLMQQQQQPRASDLVKAEKKRWTKGSEEYTTHQDGLAVTHIFLFYCWKLANALPSLPLPHHHWWLISPTTSSTSTTSPASLYWTSSDLRSLHCSRHHRRARVLRGCFLDPKCKNIFLLFIFVLFNYILDPLVGTVGEERIVCSVAREVNERESDLLWQVLQGVTSSEEEKRNSCVIVNFWIWPNKSATICRETDWPAWRR